VRIPGLVFSLAALPCFAREIPAGTEMQIRLTAPLSSESATVGARIEAVLIMPVIVNGEIFMNAGATVTGSVKSVTSTKDGAQARLMPEFSAIRDAAGHRAQLPAKLTAVDTARETVDKDGQIPGIQENETLSGALPDLTLQKLNNTFSARHHLRVWRRPESFDGRPVWVCSSTHDTGFGYSDKERTFIHQVDSDIDRERAKVVGDLVFTGKVVGPALVSRENAPTGTTNGTGDEIHTDGRMVAIEF